ncbi:MAG: hypothetical protein ACOCP8_07710 [archaeon]
MSKKRCYYCGSPSVVSKEHASPKQLFKCFICDKITVPSCEKHNENKSMDDESIIKAMLMSLDNLSEKYKYEEKILKLINKTKPHFSQVKRNVKSKLISDKLPSSLKKEIAHISENVNLNEWIKQLTAALVYSVINKYDPSNKFVEGFVFRPFWISDRVINKGIENIVKNIKRKKQFQEFLEECEWFKGWRSGKNNYPESIYKFYFSIIDESMIFKHIFFKRFNWYVIFEAFVETREIISDYC